MLKMYKIHRPNYMGEKNLRYILFNSTDRFPSRRSCGNFCSPFFSPRVVRWNNNDFSRFLMTAYGVRRISLYSSCILCIPWSLNILERYRGITGDNERLSIWGNRYPDFRGGPMHTYRCTFPVVNHRWLITLLITFIVLCFIVIIIFINVIVIFCLFEIRIVPCNDENTFDPKIQYK